MIALNSQEQNILFAVVFYEILWKATADRESDPRQPLFFNKVL